MSHINSQDSDALRVRLMALLAIYDLLPPSLDQTIFPDFNPPPEFDSSIDIDSIVHSLSVIGRKLQIPSDHAIQNASPKDGFNTPLDLAKIIENILLCEDSIPRPKAQHAPHPERAEVTASPTTPTRHCLGGVGDKNENKTCHSLAVW